MKLTKSKRKQTNSDTKIDNITTISWINPYQDGRWRAGSKLLHPQRWRRLRWARWRHKLYPLAFCSWVICLFKKKLYNCVRFHSRIFSALAVFCAFSLRCCSGFLGAVFGLRFSNQLKLLRWEHPYLSHLGSRGAESPLYLSLQIWLSILGPKRSTCFASFFDAGAWDIPELGERHKSHGPRPTPWLWFRYSLCRPITMSWRNAFTLPISRVIVLHYLAVLLN